VFIFIVFILRTFFTVSYSIRLYYLIIFNNLGVKTFLNMKEEIGIRLPMGVLLILTVIGYKETECFRKFEQIGAIRCCNFKSAVTDVGRQ
jgi:branched-subunit amino acid transport protein AzlD